MASDPTPETRPTPPAPSPAAKVRPEDAALVRDLVRRALKGTLSTLERGGGYPYASLVAVAAAADGMPLLLLSGLAEHTKNILVDNRASILFDGTSPGRAALTGPRVTLVGRIVEAPGADARRRYLSRHPDAAGFIDFADFRLLGLEVDWAHMVAGFGRIVRMERQDVLIGIDDAGELIAAEAGVLQHMNDDHGDAIRLLAVAARGGNPEGVSHSTGNDSPGWVMTGCDPEGIDLTDGTEAVRIRFPQRVTTTEQVRNALIDLVAATRQHRK